MIELAGYKIYPVFAWYDLWIGLFWDRKNRKLYILPLPTVGIVIEFPINIIMTTTFRDANNSYRIATETRTFNNILAARLYAKSRVGDDPTADDYRVISTDGNTKIVVTGCDVKALFCNLAFRERTKW